MTHTRWTCDSCRREWVKALAFNGVDCPMPGCGSTQIRQETYHAAFPGADMQTILPEPWVPDGLSVVTVATPQWHISNAIPEFESRR